MIWARAIVFIIFYNGKIMNQSSLSYDSLSRKSKGIEIVIVALSRAKQ